MRKFNFSSAAALLIIMVIVISCTPASLQDKTVKISFSAAEDKTVDTDVYSISGETTWTSSSVAIGNVDDYYWSYTAVKNDDYYKTGETTNFVNCAEVTGLGGEREFSTGAWTFTLKAFSTAEDRTSGEPAVFEGSTEVSNLKADSSVAVPVDYTYDLGIGTVNFTITTSVTQEIIEGVTETYRISKVEAVIRNDAVELTETENGKWTGSTIVTSGKSDVYINVYLDGSTEPISSEVGKAIVMSGMSTDVVGNMVVSITEKEDESSEEQINLTFYPVLPTEQPDESRFEESEELIKLVFGHLEAKAVDETAYDVTVNDPTWTAPNVVVGNAADYYWSYTAVKGDNLFKEGETATQKNVSSGAGLSGTHNFSKGKWTFTLYAYKTSEERTAGTKYIFKGEKTGTWTAGGSIDVPVSYAYIAGTGTAKFNFTVTISQEDSSTFGTTYKATKVIASIGGTPYELSNTSGTNTWSKTTSQVVASGVQSVGLKVYVDNETSPRIDKTLGSAIILHGLTTEIGGSATISLTAAKAEVTFSPVLPSTQPTEEDLKYSQYSVGSTGPAGGTIFYVADTTQTSTYYDKDGNEVEYRWKYLEAAPSESEDAYYFGYYYKDGKLASCGATQYAIGQGRMATSLLVNAMGDTAPIKTSSNETAVYAAKYADDYTCGGYDDWFLPSIHELRQLYRSGTVKYKYFFYMSSTEYSAVKPEANICLGSSSSDTDWYLSRETADVHVWPIRAFL